MDIHTYKNRLLEEKQRLETELSSIGKKNPLQEGDWVPVPQDTELASDPVDVADRQEGYGDNAAILEDLEIRLRDVDSALKKIEEGTYGICEVSGNPIEEARLNADPAAKTCLAHLT